MYINSPDLGNLYSFILGVEKLQRRRAMRFCWLTGPLLTVVLSTLEFFASPTGGRDIGRALLRHVGLRGGNGKTK
jgi:hypothetical protein